jgi:superfamily II DNA/RNA helicase
LTGDKGLAEVRGSIARIESDPQRAFEERLKVLIATSIISHGVDLERLNLMTFAGFPSSAADYIQASSRVGRSHLGIVFTVFRPENNRERNIYQRFYEYHERLYQLVQPVPINRMSQPAITRTLSGIMSASILNIIGPVFYQNHQKTLDKADNFVKAFSDGNVTDNQIIDVVKRSLGLNRSSLTGSSYDMIQELIERLVKEQRLQIQRNEDYGTHRRMRPHPVSSLREAGIQLSIGMMPGSARKVSLLMKGRK